MNTKLIKAFSVAVLFGGATFMTGCNTGTDPGETNVERGDIVEEGSMDEGYTSDEYPAEDDTTNLEKYYDNADHENHEDNGDASAVHAGDGKKDGKDRGDIDNE